MMSYRLSHAYFCLVTICLVTVLLFAHATPVRADETIFLPLIQSNQTSSETLIGAAEVNTVTFLIQLAPGANVTQLSTDYQATILGSIPALSLYRLQSSNNLMVDIIARDARVIAAEADSAVLTFEAQQESYGIASNNFDALQRYFGFGSGDGNTPDVGIQIDLKGKARYRDDVWVVSNGQTFDPAWTNWGEEKIHMFQSHTRSTGAGVKVAVLDTGVDMDHPQFAGHLLPGYDFVENDAWPDDTANGIDEDADGYFDEGSGHGTHVAGVVSIAAPQAKIIPVRVLNSDGGGSLFDIINGVVFAVDQGAQVLNFSMSSVDNSPLFASAIRYALDRRVIVIAAATGTTTSIGYPAAYDGVIAVGAIKTGGVITDFSMPYASQVDVFAPGELIFSTYTNGNFAWWSGSSMAAPFVAGEAALLLARGRDRGTCDQACVVKIIVTKVEAVKPKMGKIGFTHFDWAIRAIK